MSVPVSIGPRENENARQREREREKDPLDKRYGAPRKIAAEKY